VKIAPSKSVRRIEYCFDWPLPSHLTCSGCTEYANSPTGQKNDHREKTHTHLKYQCKQPWKVDPETSKKTHRYEKNLGWIAKVHAYIAERFDCSLRRVIDTPAQHTTTKRALSQVLNDDTPTTNSSSTSNSSSSLTSSEEVEEDGRKKKKSKEEVKLGSFVIRSTGHEFVVKNVPITHELLLSADVSRLRNVDSQMKELRESFNNYRFAAKPSPFMKSLICVALSSCPSLPLYQAANIVPLLVAAFLVDLGVL
jgi:hypothetical protein